MGLQRAGGESFLHVFQVFGDHKLFALNLRHAGSECCGIEKNETLKAAQKWLLGPAACLKESVTTEEVLCT